MAPSRRELSVGCLKGLYSVVMGLALSQAIFALAIKEQTTDPVIKEVYRVDLSAVSWFLAFFITLLPFYHGALRYLDDTYIFDTKARKPLVLLVDYLILLVQVGLFYWLALVLKSPAQFAYAFAVLLGLDVLWAMVVHFLGDAFGKVKPWMIINLIALAAMAIVRFTPALAGLPLEVGVLVLALARSLADYIWQWKFYFPEEATA